MTRMKDLIQKLERLQIAGQFEEVPLDGDQLAKMKQAGAEVASHIAYDGTHAVSTMVGMDRSSCRVQVFLPMTVAPFDVGPDDMEKYLATAHLAAYIPGSAIAIDRDARVNLAFTESFDNASADQVLGFIQRAAAKGKDAQATFARELAKLGFQTDLSRDKLLAKSAGRPVKLTAREMEAMAGGGTISKMIQPDSVTGVYPTSQYMGSTGCTIWGSNEGCTGGTILF